MFNAVSFIAIINKSDYEDNTDLFELYLLDNSLIKYADGYYTGFDSKAKVARIPSADGTTATISEDGSTATINANITASQYESSSSKGYNLNYLGNIM